MRKVYAADHFVIPGYNEVIIDIYVQRTEEDDLVNTETEFIFEPSPHFSERYPLQMATTLIDINTKVTNQIRL